MKTKITLTRAGDAAPSEPEVDWEAFARTDGSAVFTDGREDDWHIPGRSTRLGPATLYERRCGRWYFFKHGTRSWEMPTASSEQDIVDGLREGYARPVHIDIAWRPIK